jgi:hypothetical protein
MSKREMAVLAAIGFSIWLLGAVMFRFGGRLMFESGPLWLAVTTGGVAISVCLLLKATMDWRGLPAAQAVTVAVTMGLPGLFGDALLLLNLTALTGLRPETAGPCGATIIAGNGAMFAYALWRAGRAMLDPRTQSTTA